MARSTRRYSAKLKFQVVLETLRGEKTPGQIAKAYGVHPNTVGLWKHMLLERGPEIFDGTRGAETVSVGSLISSSCWGKKEVEIALLKNFLGRSV